VSAESLVNRHSPHRPANPGSALIYLAILSCSLTTATVDDLLARDPRLKELPNLDRLVAKYVENQKDRERRP
jgi:hypothetical protein